MLCRRRRNDFILFVNLIIWTIKWLNKKRVNVRHPPKKLFPSEWRWDALREKSFFDQDLHFFQNQPHTRISGVSQFLNFERKKCVANPIIATEISSIPVGWRFVEPFFFLFSCLDFSFLESVIIVNDDSIRVYLLQSRMAHIWNVQMVVKGIPLLPPPTIMWKVQRWKW